MAAQACGGKTTEPTPTARRSVGTIGDPDAAPPVVDPACSSQSVTVQRSDTPKGSCLTGASCWFAMGGKQACDRGAQLYGDEVHWNCTCPNGTWTCTPTSKGGSQILPCPDAGPEPGTDAG